MKLRHKKPINSYVGQATQDNNDAQDEDFIRAAVSCKKNQLAGERVPSEKTRKYAEFLCDFVNSINQNYRNHVMKNQVSTGDKLDKKDSKESREVYSGSENCKGNICDKSQEVVSKQQQKIQNALNVINKNATLTKKIKKERPRAYELGKNLEIKASNSGLKPAENHKKVVTLKTISVEPNPAPPKPVPRQQNPIPQQPNPNPLQNPSQIPQQPQQVLDEQLQKLLLLQQQLLQNPLYSATNPALYSLFPYSLPPFLNYQLYMEQMRANPYFGLGGPMGMLQGNLVNGCIPFSKLPFPTPGQERKLEKSVQKKQQPQLAKKPQPQPQPTVSSSKPTPQPQLQTQIPQPIHFKSKSCYHIGIAYNIHFANLKEKGCLDFNNALDYQRIDPTYPAKRARQRKISDHNIQASIGVEETVAQH